jgi:CheY-like chemotaxis protein
VTVPSYALMTTVLVVDDETDIRFLLRITLEREGYEVLEAEDGASLFTTLQDRLPDVLLLDLRMPGIDGWAVLGKLRDDARLSGIKVIAVSAHAAPNAMDRAMSMGCTAYVTKPFDLPELVRTLETVTGAA